MYARGNRGATPHGRGASRGGLRPQPPRAPPTPPLDNNDLLPIPTPKAPLPRMAANPQKRIAKFPDLCLEAQTYQKYIALGLDWTLHKDLNVPICCHKWGCRICTAYIDHLQEARREDGVRPLCTTKPLPLPVVELSDSEPAHKKPSNAQKPTKKPSNVQKRSKDRDSDSDDDSADGSEEEEENQSDEEEDDIPPLGDSQMDILFRLQDARGATRIAGWIDTEQQTAHEQGAFTVGTGAVREREHTRRELAQLAVEIEQQPSSSKKHSYNELVSTSRKVNLQQHPSQSTPPSGSNPPPQQRPTQNTSASDSNPPPQQRPAQNASASGTSSSQQPNSGQNTPPSGSNPPPQQRPAQNTSTSDSNPRPQQPSGSNSSSDSNPRPQQRPVQNASASGSNSSHQPNSGQNTPPSDSNPPPHSGGPQGPPSAAAKGKRKERDDAGDKASEPKSQRRRTDKAPKKSRKKNWAIPRNAVPAAAVGLQKAVNLHCRILMGLLSQSVAPIRLSTEAMAPFNSRFASVEDVDAQMTDILAAAIEPSAAVGEQVKEFLRTARGTATQTGSDAAAVGVDHLSAMFNAVANAGLHTFTPDVFGNPESMYNLIYEQVAVHSFRAVASNFGYSAIYRVNLNMVLDDHLVHRFYRSFVYGHMKLQAGREERRPGQLGTKMIRAVQVQEDCFMNPSVTRLVAENECHSDDEEIADATGYIVHEKPGRDGAVNAFCKRHRTRNRGFPPSDLSYALPTNIPIDYFSPDFFNKLSVRARTSYMDNGIALPTEQYCRTWKDIAMWKGLSTADFMAQYGAAKLDLYNLPTD
ncbi:hypothetical protein C8R44DRAFT_723816 [Mycena epipterygia]|nr:hypothetical protein C8R44DRAFT_723816 [Mycena epipterygia]